MAVANTPATMDEPNADRTCGLLNASPNHWSVKPDGGHVCEMVGLKA